MYLKSMFAAELLQFRVVMHFWEYVSVLVLEHSIPVNTIIS